MQKEEIKAFSPSDMKVGDDGNGTIRVLFSKYNDRDKGGDLAEAGAFIEKETLLFGYEHDTKTYPIARGKVFNTSEGGVFDGSFFDTNKAQEERKAIKGAGELQEWSYGYIVDNPEIVTEGRNFKSASVDVRHISPVYVGMGNDTRTLEVKSDESDGSKEVEETIDKDTRIAELEQKLEAAEKRLSFAQKHIGVLLAE